MRDHVHHVRSLAEDEMQLSLRVERADPLSREEVRLAVRVRLLLLRGRAREGHLRRILPVLLHMHFSEAVPLRPGRQCGIAGGASKKRTASRSRIRGSQIFQGSRFLKYARASARLPQVSRRASMALYMRSSAACRFCPCFANTSRVTSEGSMKTMAR